MLRLKMCYTYLTRERSAPLFLRRMHFMPAKKKAAKKKVVKKAKKKVAKKSKKR